MDHYRFNANIGRHSHLGLHVERQFIRGPGIIFIHQCNRHLMQAMRPCALQGAIKRSTVARCLLPGYAAVIWQRYQVLRGVGLLLLLPFHQWLHR